PRRKKRFLITGLIMLIFFSNEFIVNEALKLWEVPASSFQEISGYDTAIILTGIAGEHEPRDRVYLDKGSDRVLHTLQLYRMGKIKRILISGGSGKLHGDTVSEASELADILKLCGLPDSVIIKEEKSINTHENATLSKQILEQKHIHGKFLLVTSAFHIKRASLCFKKAGLETGMFSTDFYSHKTILTPATLLLPSEKALAKWTILSHELLGMITYKIAGYI
ncbi:MAG: YdcF family protein, partial [Cytophagaceae bacterium]